MPSLPVMKVLLRELITQERVSRVPEPDLIMADPEKVAAFTRAGREDGVMAPVYLYHCAQVCEIVRPGDQVVDLGCGPATQLAMIARLNPASEFLGVDFSDEMLDRARRHIAAEGLKNVRFHKADMTQLGFLADSSIDAVYSTVALHHLPSRDHLERTFAEVGRVLQAQRQAPVAVLPLHPREVQRGAHRCSGDGGDACNAIPGDVPAPSHLDRGRAVTSVFTGTPSGALGSSSSKRASPRSRRRSCGSFCKQRWRSRRSWWGVDAGNWSQSGSLWSTLAIVSDVVAPAKAARPVSIS